MANITVGQMRQILSKANANWTIGADHKDTDVLPQYTHGCDLTKVPLAKDAPQTDISVFLKQDTSNPFLRQLRVDNKYLQPLTLAGRITAPAGFTAAVAAVSVAPAAGGSGASSAVDWRNRWGWNWLTQIKDQGPCESCWVFSAVGTVEAMVRIEHGYWSLRSEGDVHDGLGVSCGQTGGPATAFDWMKTNGVADPGCRPYETTNTPVTPSKDRSGRTVRLDDGYVSLNTVAAQKTWIDQVGPISACFSCYYDWEAFGFSHQTGVYTCNPSSGLAGGHCIVIVGYDDARQAWLIRNSWGDGWGMAGSPGYIWMGYGQADIDAYTKYGIANSAINPDPLTKRRLHNGSFIESGDGTLNRNFEVWAAEVGNAIRHFWRDGSTLQWAVAETQANDCASTPAVTATTYNRNFEMVYRTTSNRLHHRYYDQSTAKWDDGPIFGPSNVAGRPSFIQSQNAAPGIEDAGAPDAFEVVVPLANQTLAHWTRNNSNGQWSQSATFGSSVLYGGATLVQRFDRGLDYVYVNENGSMQRCYKGFGQTQWVAEEKFGSGVKSSPVMIRSQFGTVNEASPGNYELCVAVGGQIQHWWTPGDAVANWQKDQIFGSNVLEVLGLIEGSFGFDLELVALLNDGSLQHFYRAGTTWYPGPVFGTSHESSHD